MEDIILKKQNNVIAICCDKECFKLEHLFGVGVNIINNNFVNDVYAVECNDELLNNFIVKYLRNMQHKILYKEDDKYIENNVRLFVLITVNPGEKRYLVYCENANSKKVGDIFYGLFQGSKATKIVILSCGNNITDMRNMFEQYRSLTNIKSPDNVNTENVTNMSFMFYECSSLKELDLSNLDTNSVTDMSGMFGNCTSLTNIKLHDNVNTDNVTNMSGMFDNCFKEKQTSTLICQASTIQKITEKKNSYLTITNDNENNDEIKNTINTVENQDKVYKCSVKKVGSNPEITGVKEYP